MSIAVAEGGVEEALAQLNPGIKPWDTNATLDLAANGWTTDADGNYRPQQRRYLGSNYYDVVIAPGTSPVIHSIGSSTWVNGGNVGIEYNWLVNDFNAEFWSVLEPYQSGTTPVGGQFPATGGTNYTYLLNSEGEKYYMTSLTMKQSDTMYVANNATLYVTGNILMQNKSQIVLAQGVSLTIYVGGASADFTVVNNYGKASNFSYYGLDGNTSITYGGNNSLVGSLYAPNADLKIGGGGSSIYDFQGSCMVKTI